MKAAVDARQDPVTLEALGIENEVAMRLFTPRAAELAHKGLCKARRRVDISNADSVSQL